MIVMSEQQSEWKNYSDELRSKDNVVPVHVMKAYVGRE